MPHVELFKVRRLLKGGRYQWLRIDQLGGKETWEWDRIDGTSLKRDEAEERRQWWRDHGASEFIIYHAIVPND